MDKLVLASPYCNIEDRKVYGMGQINIIETAKMIENMPVTFQPIPQVPSMALEYSEYAERDTSSMVLQHSKQILTKSLQDFEYYMNEKPNGDLEHDNEIAIKKRNYELNDVPMQLDEIMYCIEALIHRCNWDKNDFGMYKQIYESSKFENSQSKVSKLSQLRMCLMWAIPQDEYYKETSVVTSAVTSNTNLLEA